MDLTLTFPQKKYCKKSLLNVNYRYVDERKWRVTGLIAGSWLSGWVQESGCGERKWWSGAIRWFRDRCLYRFVLPWLADLVWKDCGDLSFPVEQYVGSTWNLFSQIDDFLSFVGVKFTILWYGIFENEVCWIKIDWGLISQQGMYRYIIVLCKEIQLFLIILWWN